MLRALGVALVGLAMMGLAGTASAVPMTVSFEFSASGFSPPGPVVEPLTGSFTLTFDPMGGPVTDVPADAGSIFLGSTTLTNGQIGFDYNPIGDVFLVGGINVDGDASNLAPGSADFLLGFSGFVNPTFTFMSYSDGILNPPNPGTDLGQIVVAAPEPSSLALFATALAGLAFFGWRRRQLAVDRA